VAWVDSEQVSKAAPYDDASSRNLNRIGFLAEDVGATGVSFSTWHRVPHVHDQS
jgi:hypothetical protein